MEGRTSGECCVCEFVRRVAARGSGMRSGELPRPPPPPPFPLPAPPSTLTPPLAARQKTPIQWMSLIKTRDSAPGPNPRLPHYADKTWPTSRCHLFGLVVGRWSVSGANCWLIVDSVFFCFFDAWKTYE